MTIVDVLYLSSLLVGLAGLLLAVIARREARGLRKELNRNQNKAELLQLEESLLVKRAEVMRAEEELVERMSDSLHRELQHLHENARASRDLGVEIQKAVQAALRVSDHYAESSALEERQADHLRAFAEDSRSSAAKLSELFHKYLADQTELISGQTKAIQENYQRLFQTIVSEQNRLSDTPRLRMSLPSSAVWPRRTSQVSLSAFTPTSVRRASIFILDIWAYPSHLFEQVHERAKALNRPREVGAKVGLRFPLEAFIKVIVSIPTLSVSEPADGFYWTGEPANVSYKVSVPEDAEMGSHFGEAEVFCDALKIGRLLFSVTVSEEEAVHEARTDATSGLKIIETAFASYATTERDQVLARLQGIKKVLPNVDIFVDVFSLRSGDNWRAKLDAHVPTKDVFYLFWSRAAAKSDWVEKEWRLALSRRGLDYIDPVPLESSDLAPAPTELADLHFNDAYALYLTLKQVLTGEESGKRP